MPLPWARLDANIGTHDKVLSLIADPSPKRWQALASYMVSIGWSVGQGTDGRIKRYAVGFVHGTPATARLLVKHGLWHETIDGWEIHNFADRQQTTAVTEAKHEAQSAYGAKGNCIRHHPPDCWKPSTGCSKKNGGPSSAMRVVR